MAWEATYLLSAILLVFLASGSWAQGTVVLQTVEGQTIFVDCKYDPSQRFKEKIWCQQAPEETCKILVSSLGRDAQRSRYFIQDHAVSNFFTVTMTALKMRNSGLYYCGILESHRKISVLRSVHLVVSKAPTTRKTSWMTTALASATSPVVDSPPDNWMWKVIIGGVAVAILLVLGLVVLVVLYLRNARGKAQKVENKCHHIYEDFPGQKEETTGFNQQILSSDDTETICYASLIHLNHVSPQDSISSNSHPDPKLSVEYASISRSRLQSSKAAALEVEPGN
ncbi:natural cytotoxicity triggering receptor 2-like [Cricetulus griseus]|uniref:Natural cytotoxicity triggering receptor 2-like n=1 Tax=Cricetulus griseus TaxID=10029 RepID=A0A9J7JAQ4_CRIGR|nr:natural cytotoxicity triggering receptor 2-like [Cricetulus griseus]